MTIILAQSLAQKLERFDAYFRSANGVPPNCRISVPTAEWKALRSELEAMAASKCLHAIAEPVKWSPGANEFKDWCSQWFGPDSDDSYLAKAVFSLPPMAQSFERAANDHLRTAEKGDATRASGPAGPCAEELVQQFNAGREFEAQRCAGYGSIE